MNLYELLSNVLTAIEPRNERALIWLDKLIMRCHENSTRELNPIAQRASITGMRFDFASFLLIQGADPKQKGLYDQVEHLLTQLEVSTEFAREMP